MDVLTISLEPFVVRSSGKEPISEARTSISRNILVSAKFKGQQIYPSSIHAASRELEELLRELTSEELQWYFEQYAKDDPFKIHRAQNIAQLITRQGHLLARDFINPLRSHLPTQLDIVYVVVKQPSVDSPLDWSEAVVWEILEDYQVWATVLDCAPKSISVMRCRYLSQDMLSCDTSEAIANYETRHVLALTARPFKQDIPHRYVTWSIYEAWANMPRTIQNVSSLTVVRPGSLDGLKDVLEQHVHGYFQALHLDVHGWSENGELALILAQLDEENLEPWHRAPPREVAELAASYGIKTVIMNACRASLTTLDSLKSIASKFIDSGVPFVISMKYNVIDTSARLFTHAFYTHFFAQELHLPQIVALARAELRKGATKAARYGLQVDLKDNVQVMLLANAEAIALATEKPLALLAHPTGAAELDNSDAKPPEQRRQTLAASYEDVILRLEMALCYDPPATVLLTGMPGSGKTTLLKETLDWWSRTGFCSPLIYLDLEDCAHISPSTWILDSIRNFIGLSECTEKDVLKALGRSDALLVVDSLDSASLFLEDSAPQEKEGMEVLRKTLNRLKKCTRTIMSARNADDWLGGVYDMRIPLNPVPSSDVRDIAIAWLKNNELDSLVPGDEESKREFSRILEHADGLPGAVEALLEIWRESVVDRGLTPDRFLHSLYSLSSLRLPDSLPRVRAVKDVRRLFFDLNKCCADCLVSESTKCPGTAPGTSRHFLSVFGLYWCSLPEDIENPVALSIVLRDTGIPLPERALAQQVLASRLIDLDWDSNLPPSKRGLLPLEVSDSHYCCMQNAFLGLLRSMCFIQSDVVELKPPPSQGSLPQTPPISWHYWRVNPIVTIVARSEAVRAMLEESVLYEAHVTPLVNTLHLIDFMIRDLNLWERAAALAQHGPGNNEWLEPFAVEKINFISAAYRCVVNAESQKKWTWDLAVETLALQAAVEFVALDHDHGHLAVELVNRFIYLCLAPLEKFKDSLVGQNGERSIAEDYCEIETASAKYLEERTTTLVSRCLVLMSSYGLDTQSLWRQHEDLVKRPLSNVGRLKNLADEEPVDALRFLMGEHSDIFSDFPVSQDAQESLITGLQHFRGIEQTRSRTGRSTLLDDPGAKDLMEAVTSPFMFRHMTINKSWGHDLTEEGRQERVRENVKLLEDMQNVPDVHFERAQTHGALVGLYLQLGNFAEALSHQNERQKEFGKVPDHLRPTNRGRNKRDLEIPGTNGHSAETSEETRERGIHDRVIRLANQLFYDCSINDTEAMDDKLKQLGDLLSTPGNENVLPAVLTRGVEDAATVDSWLQQMER